MGAGRSRDGISLDLGGLREDGVQMIESRDERVDSLARCRCGLGRRLEFGCEARDSLVLHDDLAAERTQCSLESVAVGHESVDRALESRKVESGIAR